MFLAVATQLPASFSISSSSIFRSPTTPQTDHFEHIFATKTKYWDQRHANSSDRTPLRQELELIQTQIVARHGIRYPTGGNIQDINALLERLQPFGRLLPEWVVNYTLPYNMSVKGELAVAGEKELRKLGRRSLARSGHEAPVTYEKEMYRVAHTHVSRTRDSAIAFAGEFFANAKEVKYIEYPKDKDTLLRFFDQCARYQREVKQNITAQEQMNDFRKSSRMAENAKWLKRALGLEGENIDFSAKDLTAVQSACAFDIALYHHKHQWCSLLSKDLLQSVEYLDDLKEFYWIGGGYKINYEMAAVLLREIFDTMLARIQDDTSLIGNFFFAHAETTLPLMTLLGYGDRSLLFANASLSDIASRGFRSSILSPFAANVEFRLFKRTSNDGEYYVQILVNEKEDIIPGCGRVFCKLSQLEKQWHYYLKTYSFHEDCM
ncbi:hypothetical protein PRIC2_006798 [Phytophthora ramorum]